MKEESGTGRVRVFQYLHRPYQVLFFEEDDLVLLVLALILALCFGGKFWILIIPFVFGYASLKRKLPRGYLRHLLYATGLVKLKGLPTFFEDKFNE